MDSEMENPWNVEDLDNFLYFCCPECDLKDQSKMQFLQHALEYHPKAKEYIQNFKEFIVKPEPIEVKPEHYEINDLIENEFQYNIESDDVETKLEEEINDVKQDLIKNETSYKSEIFNCNVCDFIEQNIDADTLKSFLSGSYSCGKCGESFEGTYALRKFRKHISNCGNIKIEKKEHKCGSCHKLFDYKSKLNRHEPSCFKKSGHMIPKLEEQENYCINDDSINVKSENENVQEGQHQYKCVSCDQEFNSPYDLHLHIDNVHFELYSAKNNHCKYECKICEMKFYRKDTLMCHSKNSHEQLSFKRKTQFKCVKCLDYFCTKSELDQHFISSHNEGRLFSCKVCGKQFMSKIDRKKHIKRDHIIQGKEEDGKETCVKSVCDLCGKILSTLNALIYHKECVHGKMKKYECKTCDTKFSTPATLRRHQVVVHEGLMKEMCTICGKKFGSKNGLVFHTKSVHSDERNELCKFCGKSFKLINTLNTHIKTVHEGLKVIGKYKCKFENCDKAFSTESRLNDHISVHEGVKNHICNQCGSTYASLNGLKHHIKAIHEGLTFKCDKCDKTFQTTYYLQHHMVSVHEGVRKFNCEHCGKSFAHKEGMNCHIKTVHEGVRYQCDYCENSFTQLPNLKKHISNSHASMLQKMENVK